MWAGRDEFLTTTITGRRAGHEATRVGYLALFHYQLQHTGEMDLTFPLGNIIELALVVWV